MKIQEKEQNIEDVDILDSIEFDLNEAIKDLIYSIKVVKNDIAVIKKHLNLK